VTIQTTVLRPKEPAIDLVRVISEGTYTSFAQALKEFVSNSFDADALRVDISISDDGSTVAVKDDGVGMAMSDFTNYFASIARTGKGGARSARGRTRLGRQKIGRFGIGALAVAGLADKFTVRSSRKGSAQGFEASIDLRELRKVFNRGEALSKHWVFAGTLWDSERTDSHFTEVRVEGVRDDVRAFLQRPGERTRAEFLDSVERLSGLDELAWELGIICPLAYERTYPVPEQAITRRRDDVIVRRSRQALRNRFVLFLNGRQVRRPIYLPSYHTEKPRSPQRQALLGRRGTGWDVRCFKVRSGDDLSCDGYLVVQAQQLFPTQLRGILIRLRGVAVGWHGTMRFDPPRGLSTMLQNMSGELWVEGIEDALQFDRESFREDHPAFRWLRRTLEREIEAAVPEFRARSQKRMALLKGGRAGGPRSGRRRMAAAGPGSEPADAPFLLPDVVRGAPSYIVRILPQINGCWERGWYEACSVMIRRLVETLISHLYEQRGWKADLLDPKTRERYGLQRMVDKVCGDARLGFDRRAADGLKHLKELGDVSAHDFRIAVKRGDLQAVREALRFTTERLLFESGVASTPS
jgi:histidine kinase/DNA gyrase B/HSP90-like ATPase